MSDNLEQVPFSNAEFANNPEPRCACLLLLDNSGSMNGSRISELNEGLRAFRDELAADSLASKRVEVGIVGDAPDFVEVGEASIAVDDAMRRLRCLQLVG
jgi:hypothetical protein